MDSVTDGSYNPEEVAYWKNELGKLMNRGYSTGFMFGEAIADPSLESHSNAPGDYRFVGEYTYDGQVFVHNKICVGDILEVVPVHGRNRALTVKKIIKNDEELSEFSAGNSESYVTLIFEGGESFEPMTVIVKKYKTEK